jgi:hypothetical protein
VRVHGADAYRAYKHTVRATIPTKVWLYLDGITNAGYRNSSPPSVIIPLSAMVTSIYLIQYPSNALNPRSKPLAETQTSSFWPALRPPNSFYSLISRLLTPRYYLHTLWGDGGRSNIEAMSMFLAQRLVILTLTTYSFHILLVACKAATTMPNDSLLDGPLRAYNSEGHTRRE